MKDGPEPKEGNDWAIMDTWIKTFLSLGLFMILIKLWSIEIAFLTGLAILIGLVGRIVVEVRK